MEARHIISALTHCGVLDADAFITLYEQYKLDIYALVDDAAWMGDFITLNNLLYVAFERIVDDFLHHIVHAKRQSRFRSTSYEIFTNYLDSSVWFDDANLQRWFQYWCNAQEKHHYLTQ